MLDRCEVIHGDSIEVLRLRAPDSIDAVVTDAPYGLSDHSAEDVSACLAAWMRGEEYRPRARGGFMGRAWDAWVPGPDLWREVFRVMKPGAFLACFAGTRTADLMGIAIRLAGFRAIDTIHWLYGQGFPKSMDISKAIDRAAGAEREVVGTKLGLPGYHLQPHEGCATFGHGVGSSTAETRARAAEVTAPAPDDAREWEGWGTQLKPAVEPILLFQKPIAERTIVANVLAHGTGGLNIDGCRVEGMKPKCTRGEGGKNGRYGRLGAQGRIIDDGRGRFPANLILSHAPGCREVGTREVRTGTAVNRNRDEDSATSWYGKRKSQTGEDVTYAGDGGAEVITAWACELGCPVAELDAQSGARKSGARKSGARKSGTYRGLGYQGADAREYPGLDGSEGGASRFFYCAKASTRERSLGLPAGARNQHTTVKPVALMRWLVRLMTPPGGVVLDPFMGSGTTGIAVRLEGFGFVGVERDEDSHITARDRIEAWREYGEAAPRTPREVAPKPEPAPAPKAERARRSRRVEQMDLFGDAA